VDFGHRALAKGRWPRALAKGRWPRALAKGAGQRALAKGAGQRALAKGVGQRALAKGRWPKKGCAAKSHLTRLFVSTHKNMKVCGFGTHAVVYRIKDGQKALKKYKLSVHNSRLVAQKEFELAQTFKSHNLVQILAFNLKEGWIEMEFVD
jgi:hypothetical protein